MAATWDPTLTDIDPVNMSAIIQMQISDGEEMAAGAKGKQREGTLTDAQLALEMYMKDLKGCDATLKDRQMAQSIAMAVLQDGALIQDAYRLEQQAARDHLLATNLSNNTTNTFPTPSSHASSSKSKDVSYPDPWDNQEMLDKVAAIYMPPSAVSHPQEAAATHDDLYSDSDNATVAESSAWAAARTNADRPARRVCIACGDEKEFHQLARVPCNHEYCRPCLESLFSLSMKDESLFPPRCDHQEIPVAMVAFFLPSALVKEFNAKYEELSTKNRTYCHDRLCSAFISTSPNDEYGTCPLCEKTTCTTCKSPSHTGDCPEDTALQQLLDTANASQWQRCYQCKRIVELQTGCNHMTCPCKAEFCYVCGARWHTCGCPQWDENRLVERAAQLVDRNPQRRLFQPQRVAHAQPRRPSIPASIAAVVNAPLQRGRSVPRLPENDDGAWESDFSDHSEWQHNWWENLAQDNEDPLLDPQEEMPTPPTEDPPTPATRSPLVEMLRNDRIAVAMEHLRANHACTHDKWRWVRGGHRCEECHHFLREYIFECRQCQLQACNRCRRNRL